MKKHIPNLITLLNLFSGCIAVLFAVTGDFVNAALFVFIGIFFDFFDGFFARKFKVESDIGLQLDSLADMVTSGLVPGIVMFQLLRMTISSWTYEGSNSLLTFDFSNYNLISYLPLLGFLITLASAYRLAKFNIADNQSNNFIGLPTPANALLILSLPLILEYQNSDLMNSIIVNKGFLIVVTFLSCFMLNANIKLLALKFQNFSFQDNASRYILIVLSAVLLVLFHFAAIPLIIICYVIISLLNR